MQFQNSELSKRGELGVIRRGGVSSNSHQEQDQTLPMTRSALQAARADVQASHCADFAGRGSGNGVSPQPGSNTQVGQRLTARPGPRQPGPRATPRPRPGPSRGSGKTGVGPIRGSGRQGRLGWTLSTLQTQEEAAPRCAGVFGPVVTTGLQQVSDYRAPGGKSLLLLCSSLPFGLTRAGLYGEK